MAQNDKLHRSWKKIIYPLRYTDQASRERVLFRVSTISRSQGAPFHTSLSILLHLDSRRLEQHAKFRNKKEKLYISVFLFLNIN